MTAAFVRLPLITLCLLAGCGGGASAPAPAVPSPAIPPAPVVEAPTLDLRNGPIVPRKYEFPLVGWVAEHATACNASGDWSGPQALSGEHSTTLSPGNRTYTLTCTGPGGSVSKSVNEVIPYPVFTTSYANAKNFYPPISFPSDPSWDASGGPLAWSSADFFRTGSRDLFTANQNYTPDNVSEATAKSDPRYLSDFVFWRHNADNTYTKVSSMKGCLHPRKSIVVDFNGDGVPDVFVACHGYDAAPFPGERNKLLLSDGKGGFAMSDVGDIGFYHGAAAADVNGDGYKDIVVADNSKNPSVYFLINQKNGTFVADRDRIPSLLTEPRQGPYFSVELEDADGDGVLDLLIGGHEQSGAAPTRILFGANGNFGANGAFVTVPAVPGRGVVLDFTLAGNRANRIMYVNRTSDATSAEGFYGTRTLQRVDLATLKSTILLDERARWIPWWIPVGRDSKTGVAPYSDKFNYFYAD